MKPSDGVAISFLQGPMQSLQGANLIDSLSGRSARNNTRLRRVRSSPRARGWVRGVALVPKFGGRSTADADEERYRTRILPREVKIKRPL